MDCTPAERDLVIGCLETSHAAANARSAPSAHRFAAEVVDAGGAPAPAAELCAPTARHCEPKTADAGAAARGGGTPLSAHATAKDHDPADLATAITATLRRAGAAGPEPDGGGEAVAHDARHAEKMRKRKAARDRMMAQKTIEKGLLIVHTGAGKGKSTAAFGMVMRCIGHAMPVGIVQFIKGRLATGETAVLERFADLVTLRRMGEGFTWETQDRARDVAAARAAWDVGREMIASGAYAMVVLDELNIALRYDYLPLAEVLAVLATRPPGVHVVVTGRNAKEELIAAADLVTEMTMVKHPFRSGVKPQAGIEF